VSLIIALALALFVLPSPWNLIAVVAAALWELATALGGLWWSQRRAAKVGVEALIGREVEVRRACRPVGEVRVRGEIWQARCDDGADTGDSVRIVGLDGLTLLVEPVLPA
jgi:membrane-bound serine protease (ClpP class)